MGHHFKAAAAGYRAEAALERASDPELFTVGGIMRYLVNVGGDREQIDAWIRLVGAYGQKKPSPLTVRSIWRAVFGRSGEHSGNNDEIEIH